jgi:hypothetical protein
MNFLTDRAAPWVRGVLVESYQIIVPLFRIMIPVIILVKILQEVGLVEVLGSGLAPLMDLVGLPGSMGLVWAATLLSGLYTGVVVFADLSLLESLTVGQVSVLSSMMLIAHALPIELRIVAQAGPRMWSMGVLRIGGALLYGFLLDQTLRAMNWLQEPARLLWTPEPHSGSLLDWVWSEVQSLGWVIVILIALVVLMRLFDALRITQLLQRLLTPLLSQLGVGREATNLTVIGVTLGIAYGSGLILREARTGRIPPRDVFFSLSLMGLFHSVIEDTLLMLLIGADWVSIVFGRMLFSLVVMWGIVRLSSRVPEVRFQQWFWRPTS